MKRCDFKIAVGGEPWDVTVFLPITGYHVAVIMRELLKLGINKENYDAALENLTSGRVNNGLTFSSMEHRQSVSVWATATSPSEWFNLIVHELHHLSVQIATCHGMDLEGEEVCYLNGDTAGFLYSFCKPLLL